MRLSVHQLHVRLLQINAGTADPQVLQELRDHLLDQFENAERNVTELPAFGTIPPPPTVAAAALQQIALMTQADRMLLQAGLQALFGALTQPPPAEPAAPLLLQAMLQHFMAFAQAMAAVSDLAELIDRVLSSRARAQDQRAEASLPRRPTRRRPKTRSRPTARAGKRFDLDTDGATDPAPRPRFTASPKMRPRRHLQATVQRTAPSIDADTEVTVSDRSMADARTAAIRARAHASLGDVDGDVAARRHEIRNVGEAQVSARATAPRGAVRGEVAAEALHFEDVDVVDVSATAEAESIDVSAAIRANDVTARAFESATIRAEAVSETDLAGVVAATNIDLEDGDRATISARAVAPNGVLSGEVLAERITADRVDVVDVSATAEAESIDVSAAIRANDVTARAFDSATIRAEAVSETDLAGVVAATNIDLEDGDRATISARAVAPNGVLSGEVLAERITADRVDVVDVSATAVAERVAPEAVIRAADVEVTDFDAAEVSASVTATEGDLEGEVVVANNRFEDGETAAVRLEAHAPEGTVDVDLRIEDNRFHDVEEAVVSANVTGERIDADVIIDQDFDGAEEGTLDVTVAAEEDIAGTIRTTVQADDEGLATSRLDVEAETVERPIVQAATGEGEVELTARLETDDATLIQDATELDGPSVMRAEVEGRATVVQTPGAFEDGTAIAIGGDGERIQGGGIIGDRQLEAHDVESVKQSGAVFGDATMVAEDVVVAEQEASTFGATTMHAQGEDVTQEAGMVGSADGSFEGTRGDDRYVFEGNLRDNAVTYRATAGRDRATIDAGTGDDALTVDLDGQRVRILDEQDRETFRSEGWTEEDTLLRTDGVDQLRVVDGAQTVYDDDALPTIDAAVAGHKRYIVPNEGETPDEAAHRTSLALREAEAAIRDNDPDRLIASLEGVQHVFGRHSHLPGAYIAAQQAKRHADRGNSERSEQMMQAAQGVIDQFRRWAPRS